MKLNHLIELCKPLHVTGDDFEIELGSFELDSRKVQENSVFIALRGTEVDGHLFLDDAIDRGARVILTEETYYTEKEGVCVIEVEDTRSLIGKLAQEFAGNPAEKMIIVGITGTNGKTTTATLVYQILSALGKKASLLGTVNKRILDEVIDSQLTTSDPIELAEDMSKMAEAGSEYLVMEVSSHALHQGRVSGFDFQGAAFTNLSQDHLDYHETLNEYAATKKLLFDQLPADSFAVVNTDDPHGNYMVSDCEARIQPLSFGNGNSHILESSTKGLNLVVDGTKIESPLTGTFNAYNIGQAFLICRALGLDEEKISEALMSCKGAPGRMETVIAEGENLPTVIVDYAHTPDALENVLRTLNTVKSESQKVTLLFGAGGDRDTAKRPLMAQAAEKYASHIIVTSDNPRTENPDLIIADILDGFNELKSVESITDRRKAIEKSIAEAGENDIILIAGKGHEDYQDIQGVKRPFDDRKIARAALQNKAGGGS